MPIGFYDHNPRTLPMNRVSQFHHSGNVGSDAMFAGPMVAPAFMPDRRMTQK
jgi:hypothetical protein